MLNDFKHTKQECALMSHQNLRPFDFTVNKSLEGINRRVSGLYSELLNEFKHIQNKSVHWFRTKRSMYYPSRIIIRVYDRLLESDLAYVTYVLYVTYSHVYHNTCIQSWNTLIM